MTRSDAKRITMVVLERSPRFRLIVDYQGSMLFSVIERVSASEHRFCLGEHGTQVWYASRDDAEAWLKRLESGMKF